ncbi:MAG: hypothetical protein QOJ34_1774, partial [Pseudonocardiales bacterium]|nr:hypothetical protein [Pseudonocardiales bacterium]
AGRITPRQMLEQLMSRTMKSES